MVQISEKIFQNLSKLQADHFLKNFELKAESPSADGNTKPLYYLSHLVCEDTFCEGEKYTKEDIYALYILTEAKIQEAIEKIKKGEIPKASEQKLFEENLKLISNDNLLDERTKILLVSNLYDLYKEYLDRQNTLLCITELEDIINLMNEANDFGDEAIKLTTKNKYEPKIEEIKAELIRIYKTNPDYLQHNSLAVLNEAERLFGLEVTEKF